MSSQSEERVGQSQFEPQQRSMGRPDAVPELEKAVPTYSEDPVLGERGTGVVGPCDQVHKCPSGSESRSSGESPGVAPRPGGGQATNAARWAKLEARAKAEAKELGVPYHKTPSFMRLQDEWYGRLAKTGFKDIEVQDPKTGEAGSFMLGIHTAKILDRIGPEGHKNAPDSVKEAAASKRAKAAILVVESQMAWFDVLKAEVAVVRSRWPKAPWRWRAMELYAEGKTWGEIADALNARGHHSKEWPKFTRAQMKVHLCNEVKRILRERGQRWEEAKAAIRAARAEGAYDE